MPSKKFLRKFLKKRFPCSLFRVTSRLGPAIPRGKEEMDGKKATSDRPRPGIPRPGGVHDRCRLQHRERHGRRFGRNLGGNVLEQFPAHHGIGKRKRPRPRAPGTRGRPREDRPGDRGHDLRARRSPLPARLLDDRLRGRGHDGNLVRPVRLLRRPGIRRPRRLGRGGDEGLLLLPRRGGRLCPRDGRHLL